VPDATFVRPDLTTFTRVDELGLEVVVSGSSPAGRQGGDGRPSQDVEGHNCALAVGVEHDGINVRPGRQGGQGIGHETADLLAQVVAADAAGDVLLQRGYDPDRAGLVQRSGRERDAPEQGVAVPMVFLQILTGVGARRQSDLGRGPRRRFSRRGAVVEVRRRVGQSKVDGGERVRLVLQIDGGAGQNVEA
jgi:hypothetical protein